MESLGRRCLSQQDYSQALLFFEQKHRIDPNNADLDYLIKLTRLKLDPNNPVTKSNLQDGLVEYVLKQKDYYSLFGLDMQASQKEIVKSYRSMALVLHPDKNRHPEAGHAFVKATRAYETLTTPDKKDEYDATLRSQQASLDSTKHSLPDFHRSRDDVPAHGGSALSRSGSGRTFSFSESPTPAAGKQDTTSTLSGKSNSTPKLPGCHASKRVYPNRELQQTVSSPVLKMSSFLKGPQLSSSPLVLKNPNSKGPKPKKKTMEDLDKSLQDQRLRLSDMRLETDYRQSINQLRSLKDACKISLDLGDLTCEGTC